MPRARSLEPNEEPVKKVVRRAPRKKAVVTPVSEHVEGLIPTLEERVEADPVVRTEKAPVRRRAPRVVPAVEPAIESPRLRRSYVPYVVVGVIFFSSIGISALVGFSDQGKIDVTSRMSEQSALQAEANGGSVEDGQVIPVQNPVPPSVPNGGLIGQGVLAAGSPPVEVPAVLASTSSSTPDISTTTPLTEEVDTTITDEAVGSTTASVNP